MDHNEYASPLNTRYASAEMRRLWGEQRKFGTWRRLWVALAEAERELGLDITDEQIAEMRAQVDAIDFESARQYERKLRHDVMAHVHTFGDACPSARKIIHWGATSCFVTDNTDLLLMRDALVIVRQRIADALAQLAQFARRHRETACLAFTHFQPAQPTTVGKRACLWAQDLVLDVTEIEHRLARLQARGVKGTTGTQASFLQLFDGDHEKVRELERRVAAKIGFESTFAVTGQTYPRKVDSQVLDALAGIGQSAHKAATDLRLLAGRKEIEEPFETDQIGSSAMAYKRNPMRCERICGLARYLMALPPVASQTAATQWMERTLDDSAARRIVLPEAFLAVDAILILYVNVMSGAVVYPAVIARHLAEELPFMATEGLLMEAVRAGGDRQDLHERIRKHSLAAGEEVKVHGRPNDLVARLQADPAFQSLDLDAMLDPSRYVGRAPRQVDEFLDEIVAPILARLPTGFAPTAEVRV
ncbi:MAG: adenylosuccinate lyase [Planctomycetes bacterium]|nr:adenylosuccinate lyase [Planctomycetota bacterium]